MCIVENMRHRMIYKRVIMNDKLVGMWEKYVILAFAWKGRRKSQMSRQLMSDQDFNQYIPNVR
jgi:hypothetical protein